MVSHGEGDELTDTEQNTFVSKLQQLKENGSSLLVVGNVPDKAAKQACHWMLGDDSVTERRRLFVSTDPDLPSISERLSTSPDRLDPETTKLITWTTNLRSTSTVAPAQPPQPPYDSIEPVQVESGKLTELGITISREIKSFQELADELSPSELRICFDSLTALAEEYDQKKLFQFLHILVDRIRSVQAMAHFHFPVDYESTQVKQIAPVFDAIIELRMIDGEPKQRWHLRDEGISSGWITPSPSF